jgi:exodeoxyribonuclease VII small subunit
MAEAKIPKNITDMSLEVGQVKLDEAVKHYERGAMLKRHCEAKLADARMKVEKITGLGDSMKLEDMDSE